MPKKTKTFDCVDMTNRIQAEMLAEYEAHKDEYPSFAEFVKARTDDSEWVRGVREKLASTTPRG
jgi:hypothetical protein